MRRKPVVAVGMALSMIAAAQSVGAQSAPRRYGAAAPPAPSVSAVRPDVPPAPAPQVPPPTITPAPTLEPSPFAATPSTYAPHYTSSTRGRRERFRSFSPAYGPGYGYVVPFSAGADETAVVPRGLASGQLDASGRLEIDIEPRTAQVYVDGFYVGTVDDFWPTGVPLPAGRHRVDLRAPGYEMLTIPVDIAANAAGQPMRFRGVLTALRTSPPQAIPPRRPETMYVIPGCYAGNRPPQESALARGCDVSRLHVLH